MDRARVRRWKSGQNGTPRGRHAPGRREDWPRTAPKTAIIGSLKMRCGPILRGPPPDTPPCTISSIPSNAEGCAACAPGRFPGHFRLGRRCADFPARPADPGRHRPAGRRRPPGRLLHRQGPAAGHAADVARRPGGDDAPQLRCCARICRKPCSSACPCSCCAPRPSWPRPLHACGVRPPTTPSWPRSKPPPAAAAPDLGTRRAAVGHLDRRALGGRRTALVVDRLGRAAGRRLRPGRRADADRRRRLARGRPGRRHPLDRRRHPGPVHSADRQPGTDPGRELHQGLLSRPGSGGAQPLPRHGQAPHGLRPRRGGAQEGALANVDVYDAAQPDEPVAA